MKTLVLVGAVLLALLGCSVNVEDSLDRPVLDSQAQQAMLLAQQEVKSISSDKRSGGWNSSSTVVDSFPLYLDGIDEISYYECKVMTDGNDSGYVLININNTDFPVVEAQEYGITVNETFEKMTEISKEKLVICRYSYTANAAFMKRDTTDSILRSRGANASPIATIGFISDDFDYDHYRTQIKAKGGSLFSTVETLPQSDTVLLEMTGKGNAEVSLLNIWENRDGILRATPPWNQFLTEPVVANQEKYNLVGCGAIAHGIVLAYWDEFKSCPKLFSASVNNSLRPLSFSSFVRNYSYIPQLYSLSSEIMEIAKVIKTTPVGMKRKNFTLPKHGRPYIKYRQGYTPTFNMPKIMEYITDQGYSSTVTRKNGTYDKKFNMIYDSLAEDRPVIMAIQSAGIGVIDHYVVVERAKRQSVCRNSYIRYFCNFGWGEGDDETPGYRWVYAYNQKSAQSTGGATAIRCSTFQIWDIKIH